MNEREARDGDGDSDRVVHLPRCAFQIEVERTRRRSAAPCDRPRSRGPA